MTDKKSNQCNHSHDNHNHHHHQHHHPNHHHGHHHHLHSASQNLKVAFFLNLIFAVIEIVGGFYTNSIAILSDAVHDLGDSLAIGLAWYLEKYSHKGSDNTFSYGYRRFSTLGALIIGLILVFSSVFILVKAVPRLINPEPTGTFGMLLLAVLGIVVNGYAAFRMSKGSSLNEKMVSWHLLEDLLGWVLVLIGALVIYFFKWYQVDAALAIILAAWIIYNVFSNLRATLSVFLQASPTHLKIEQMELDIGHIPKVKGVHHSHLWSIDGEKHIYTTHVVVGSELTLKEIELVKKSIKRYLQDQGVFESNIEIESSDAECADPQHQ